MSRLAACLTLLLALATPLHAQEPAKATRILFIGNALTSQNDIPARVEKVARATGRKAVVEVIAKPDFGLQDHWQDGEAAKAIAKGWDLVVLQQGSTAASGAREQLIDYSTRFARLIRDAGAKPVLYMTWPASDRMRDYPNTISAYRAAASAIDGLLAPVGEAWLRILSADKRVRLYGSVTSPSSLGADLAALTIYLSLFPAGPQEFDDAFVNKIAKALEIPPDLRDKFFDAATRAIDEPMPIP